MKAGALDRRISILRAGARVDDGYSDTDGPLEILFYRWASWRPANGRETFENQGKEAKAGGSFWLRSDSATRGIAETDKVHFEGGVWDILSITELNRREGLELIVAASDQPADFEIVP
jgi:head-tail adaptor